MLFDLGVKQRTLMIACGGNHTLILNQENDVYAFGDNTHGQLGLSDTESHHIPHCIYFFQEKVVTWIQAGTNHSGCLTVEGYVYTWG
jgi:alpha-tubulin suppressor-like RCC1 family protein